MCDCSLALLQCEVGVVVRWKKIFLYRIALYELKKQSFSAKQEFAIYRKLTNRPQKPLVFATETPLFEQLFTVCKNRLLTYKNLSFAQAFPCGFQKPPIFTNQKLCFYPNFFLFPPKATLFHPPLPISTPLNLLFAKNTAVLLLFA